MRLRKKAARPQGWRERSSHFRKRNVPRELIGNPEWFTPPNTLEKPKGIKRGLLFLPYSKPSTRKVIGTDSPMSFKKPKKSKVLGLKKIKQWISV